IRLGAVVKRCLCHLGYIVSAGCEIENKNIANGEGLLGSPSGVCGGTTGRDSPPDRATHRMGGLSHRALEQSTSYQQYSQIKHA
ncbi:hypothetical protein, partial [Salmonella sp. s57610]|uniref:hypothetical protein n=1 Tax=Salmonella sp. s57610 TaxID=3159697 RepID=UPI0039815248